MRREQIDVYTIVRNEAALLPFFLRHYATFADRIFVVDDASTDATVAIAAACPIATVLPYSGTTGLDELAVADEYARLIATHSRGVAQWVCCPDADELLYHEDIRAALQWRRRRRAVVVKATGFIMVAGTDLPIDRGQQLYEDVKWGVRARHYDKSIIFDPIVPARFGTGRHRTAAPGFRERRCGIRLLHYCYWTKAALLDRLRRKFANMRGPQRSAECAYREWRALKSYDWLLAHRQQVIA